MNTLKYIGTNKDSWNDYFTINKFYKKVSGGLKYFHVKANDGKIKFAPIEMFEEASAIEVIVYYLLIGVKYLMLLLGIAAFIAAITGAYHQFYVSALAFLLYYLQTKKLL